MIHSVDTHSSDQPSAPDREIDARVARANPLPAVNSLDERDRQVIACRFFLDLDVADSAAILGCPQGTVKSRLSRALQRLRERLSVEADGK